MMLKTSYLGQEFLSFHEDQTASYSPSARWVLALFLKFSVGFLILASMSNSASASSPSINLTQLPDSRENVSDFVVSPDNTRVVYRAAQDTASVHDIYSVPTDGSAPPVKLSSPPSKGWRQLTFEITPDSSRVVFAGESSSSKLRDLYSVPLDGSAPPIQLNDSLVEGFEVDSFTISPDGAWVVYRIDQVSGSSAGYYRVSVDGNGAPIELNIPVEARFAKIRISSDSSWIVYQTEINKALHSLPLDTPASPTELTQTEDGTYLSHSELSSDGTRLIYTIKAGFQHVKGDELYSVPIDGSEPPTRLVGPLQTEASIDSILISPDSSRVVYWVYQGVPPGVNFGRKELYSVSVDGNSSPIKLNGPLVEGGSVESFAISTDSTRVVYHADQNIDGVEEIFSVPLGGGAFPAKLNGALGEGRSVDAYQISEDSSQVVYLADQEREGVFELFSVALDGSSSPLKLNGPLADWENVAASFAILPDSSGVVYHVNQDFDAPSALYSVALDGSEAPVPLDAPSVNLAYKNQTLTVSADSSRVVFLASDNLYPLFELFSAPVDGSVPPSKLNGPLVSSTSGTVSEVKFSADGSYVFYILSANRHVNLYGVPVNGSSAPSKINGGLNLDSQAQVNGFFVSPAGSRVVYRSDLEVPSLAQLYSAPFTGDGRIAKLNGPLVSEAYWENIIGGNNMQTVRITPDSSQVIFSFFKQPYFGFYPPEEWVEFYSAPLDGSAPPRLLYSVSEFSLFPDISPDSSRLVYSNCDDDRFYTIDLNGEAPPIDLGEHHSDYPLTTGISPDSSRLVYRDALGNLYSVLLDGSSPAVRLNARNTGSVLEPTRTLPSFVISPDSSLVIYRGGREWDSEAYSVPLDGSQQPRLMENVGDFFTITPDSSRVVYREKYEHPGPAQLFSVPLDLSTAPVDLTGSLAAQKSVDSTFVVSADSSRAVFLIGDDLYSVRVDGSETAVKLSSFGPVDSFKVSPDSSYLVYEADRELYSVPLNGSEEALKISDYPLLYPPASPPPGTYEISPDSSKVIYVGAHPDQGADIYVNSITGGPIPFYVDASAPPGGNGVTWNSAYQDLQSAIAAAPAGCEIRMAQGVYYPDEKGGENSDARDASFVLGGDLTLVGGFPAGGGSTIDPSLFPTVLSGDIEQSGMAEQGCYQVVRVDDGDDLSLSKVTLEGLTITGGYADGAGSQNEGAGIWNAENLSLINVTLSENIATGSGGGIFSNQGSVVSVDRGVFEGNAALNGGAAAVFSEASFTNCVFSGNSAEESGGAIDGGGAVVERFLQTGDVWKYLDDGSDQGEAWREMGFDDGEWLEGASQLGYGDGDETTVINYVDVDSAAGGVQKNATTYFRKRVMIANPSAFEEFVIDYLFDDGVAVYVNGVERARQNLADGAAYDEYATAQSDDNTRRVVVLGSADFVAGENVIAAEVHQRSAVSSDVSFDLELRGRRVVDGSTSISMTNCSLAGNSAEFSGGAIRGSLIEMTNCIVWGNTAPIFAEIEGSLTGRNNLNEGEAQASNPLFIRNPGTLAADDYGDLRLQMNSPALESGLNEAISTPGDLADQARIVGTVDLGAFEGYYTTFELSGFSDPNGDDNGNGISNFAEYVRGGDPAADDDLALLPLIDLSVLRFSSRPNAADAEIRYEVSRSLLPGSWKQIAEENLPLEVVPVSVDRNEVIFTLPEPFERLLFFRQRIIAR
ncbi:MAG: hypothetical protein ACSHYF_09070 [Verrucomicrobiaceae bacterium]